MNRQESPEEIEAEIQQTRAKMGAKVDQLENRLDPERLRQQAMQTTREAMEEGANAVANYVRTNRRQIRHSMIDTVRSNPLPAAMIGIGLGWMVVDSLSTDKGTDVYRSRREQRYPYSYQPEESYRGTDEPYPVSAGGGIDTTYGGSYTDGPQQGRTEEMRDRAQGAAESARDTARDTVDKAGQRAGEAGDRLKETADRARSQVEQTGRQMGRQLKHEAQNRAQSARRQTRSLYEDAQDQASRTGQQAYRSLEQNPLMYGALAFAIGAGIGMLLPQTRAEDRMMGEARDEALNLAGDVADDVGQRTQRVARDVVDEVKEAGEKAADDIQSTMSKAQDKAKSEAEGAAERAQEQAKSRAQNMGSDESAGSRKPEASQSRSATKSDANRQILKGQWNQLKGNVKKQWGKLTDDDVTRVEGDYDTLVGIVQERYGYEQKKARNEVDAYLDQYESVR